MSQLIVHKCFRYGQKLAEQMGCNSTSANANQVECLRNLTTHEIIVDHPGTFGRSMLEQVLQKHNQMGSLFYNLQVARL